MLRTLLLCSLLLAPPLFADTLSIPLGAQGDTRAALPVRHHRPRNPAQPSNKEPQ